MNALFPVAVHGVVNGSFVVLLKDIDIENVLTDKLLLGNRGNEIPSVAIENNHIIQIRTVGNKLILLQCRTNESFVAVNV
ncbi:hypothetical protein SDC9_109941 [bioreactor metagenome]|uniref:Uncharacterized protein n=1 Tax=bioreactor metagenome TaxID=1076179 RepID=A0A645BIN7_9ZZZZ